MFRVIIAGSRDFNNYEFLSSKMDRLLSNIIFDDIIILCGEARGADTLGKRYAIERGYDIESYPADWNKYGKSAGYIRNSEMAKNADALAAFWDGKSKGTGHMINLAKEHGLMIRIIDINKIEVLL